MNSFCYQRLLYCQKVLNKEATDEQYFIFITKADEDENGNVDYTNPIEHEKANPNYGVTIRPQDMLNESMQAMNDPSSRDEFYNKSLNIYTNAMSAYFNMTEVKLSDKEHSFTIDELAKLPITWFGGADLSKQFDLTGAALYGRYNDIDIVITHGFIPVTEAKAKAEKDNIPFFEWKDNGWLTMTNSEIVDHEEIVKWFKFMRNKGFKIKNIGFDRQYSRDFVRSMEKLKFKMVDSGQQYWKKSEAFREIERKIKEKKFTYLDNKAYEYCIGNVRAVEDSQEKVRFEKVGDNFRIDLFDASVMACKQGIIDRDSKTKSANWFG